MKVYRVQHTNGLGPYRNHIENLIWREVYDGKASKEIERIHDLHTFQRPNPIEDFGWKSIDPDEYVFGFETYDQYRSWFTKSCRKLLAKHDYQLVIFDVPKKHVLIGQSQVAFKPDKADILDILDIKWS